MKRRETVNIGMLMRTPTVTAAPLPDDFQPYKYGGKELDRENGLDLYDFAARQYDPATGRFTTVDPKAESYPHLSPYLYCAANPIRNIDPTGMDVAILNYGNYTHQHLALLRQNHNVQWKYYSMNGIKYYKSTDGIFGGKPYHDLGEKSFSSPKAFLNSKYNDDGNKSEIKRNSVSGYSFSEAYVIPTTEGQDDVFRAEFKRIVINEPYTPLNTNCAKTVERSLEKVNIPTASPQYVKQYVPANHKYGEEGFDLTISNRSVILSKAFHNIMRLNPKGKYIKKNK